jgi:hypothetical protein
MPPERLRHFFLFLSGLPIIVPRCLRHIPPPLPVSLPVGRRCAAFGDMV